MREGGYLSRQDRTQGGNFETIVSKITLQWLKFASLRCRSHYLNLISIVGENRDISFLNGSATFLLLQLILQKGGEFWSHFSMFIREDI